MASTVLVANVGHFGVNGRLPYSLPIQFAPNALKILKGRRLICQVGHFGVNGRFPYTLPIQLAPNSVGFRTNPLKLGIGQFAVNTRLPYSLPIKLDYLSVTFRRGIKVACTSGSYTLSGTSALIHRTTVNLLPGSFSLTGIDPAIENDHKLVAQSATFNQTGQSIKIHRSINGQGTYTISGIDATATETNKVNCEAGSYILTGQSIKTPRKTPLAQGIFSLTGISAILRMGSRLIADQGIFILSDIPMQPLRAGITGANVGHFNWIGGDAFFQRATPITPFNLGLTGISIVAFKGIPLGPTTYTLASIDLRVSRVIKLEPTSFSLTPVNPILGYKLSANATAYNLTGIDAIITERFEILADQGLYHLLGKSVRFNRRIPLGSTTYTLTPLGNTGKGIKLANGSFAVSGLNVKVSLKKKLDSIAYNLTGKSANIKKSRVFAKGSFTVTGLNTSFGYGTVIKLSKGAFSLQGVDLNLKDGEVTKANVGAYNLVGKTVRIHRVNKLAQGSFLETGVDLILNYTRNIKANPGVFALSGKLMYPLTPLKPANYSLTGLDLKTKRSTPLQPGEFNLTGIDVSIKIQKVHTGNRLEVKQPVNRILTVKPPTARKLEVKPPAKRKLVLKYRNPLEQLPSGGGSNTILPADIGTFNLVGLSVGIVISQTLQFLAGSFSMVGLGTLIQRSIKLLDTTYTSMGLEVKISRSIKLATGSIIVTGINASANKGRTLVCASGTFTETGIDASLYQFNAQYSAVVAYARAQSYALPSKNQQILQNTLMASMVSSGVFSKQDLLYIMANDAGLDFARINWKSPGDYTLTDYGTGQCSYMLNYGPYADTESANLQCLDTGWKPSNGVNFTQNNACIIHAAKSGYGGCGFPYRTANPTTTTLNAFYLLDGIFASFLNSNTIGTTAANFATQIYMNRRTGASSAGLYNDSGGVVNTLYSSAVASAARDTVNLMLLGADIGALTYPNPSLNLGHPLGCTLVGAALTDTEFLAFSSAFNTYISTIRYSAIVTAPGAGSYTVPAGITQLLVECFGGGGAGQGYPNVAATTTGNGGAGGGYSASIINVTPGQVIPYVVGAGGTAGIGAGGAGGDTSWDGGVILAKGGAGGSTTANTQAQGGQASAGVGTIKYSGGNGGAGGTVGNASSASGGSGAGALGNGVNGVGAVFAQTTNYRPNYNKLGPGAPGYSLANSANSSGIAGMISSGGGGARRTSSTRAGGAGGPGFIRVSAVLTY